MTDFIKRRESEGIMTLALDRPQKKNALTPEMYAALADGFTATANEASGIKVVILEGGDDMFTAGNDLAGFLTANLSPTDKPPVWRFIDAVIDCPVPVIAAVTGPAIGIGATILLHCDLVYAHRAAYLHMPFTDLAAVPEAGASFILPRRFGRQIAGEMLIDAAKIPVTRAARFGLVNDVISGDVRQHAAAVAARIAAKPPQTMRKAKALMHGDTAALKAHIEIEMKAFAESLASEEMRAVIQKMMSR